MSAQYVAERTPSGAWRVRNTRTNTIAYQPNHARGAAGKSTAERVAATYNARIAPQSVSRCSA